MKVSCMASEPIYIGSRVSSEELRASHEYLDKVHEYIANIFIFVHVPVNNIAVMSEYLARIKCLHVAQG